MKLTEQEKQKRSDRKELASKNERLQNELDAAKETGARLKGVVRGCKTSYGTKRGTRKRESHSGRKGSIKSNGGPEMRSSARKSRKGKYNVCKLCCKMK